MKVHETELIRKRLSQATSNRVVINDEQGKLS